MEEVMQDYKDAATFFIGVAFDVLNTWSSINKTPGYSDTHISASLEDPYELRINAEGQLYLIKYNKFDPKGYNIIGHTFSEKYSQITYIGKLLAVYLEYLQTDNS